jgi:hypothetical protein
MLATNASDAPIAIQLADLSQTDQGTLVYIKVRKMGDARGPSTARVIYGDDLVAVLIWSGFSYKALVARSDKKLNELLNRGRFIEKITRYVYAQHQGVTVDDVCNALQETRVWFRRVLAEGTGIPSAPNGGAWDPFRVDGEVVRGAKVYVGPARPQDARAPIPGTLYVAGVKLGETVIEPAANGPWRPDSSAKTLAKEAIKSLLPIGLYCQYRLEPERVIEGPFVGRQASMRSKAIGVQVDPESVRSLFKIAP